MTVIIACGFQGAWCQFASQRLVKMGINEPVESQRVGVSFPTLFSKVERHYRLNIDDAATIRPVDLGGAWQISIADLLLANADQNSWVWSDPRNIFFLDFWRNFDQEIRFVFLYGSIGQDLAHFVDQFGADEDMLRSRVESWHRFHNELLLFYHNNPDQCLLAHIDCFNGSASEAVAGIAGKFDLLVRKSNKSEYMQRSAILEMVSSNWLKDQGIDGQLFEELNCSADLPQALNDTRSLRELSTVKEYKALSKATADLEIEKKAVSELEIKTKSLAQTVATLQSDLTAANARVSHLEASSASNDLRLENELMRRQMHQVQEELERYFHRYQKLKQSESKPASKAKSANLIDRLSLDLRQYLSGDGWHNAEAHGRWAGEKTSSSISLPEMEQGRYRVAVEVVDSMSIDILRAVKLRVDTQVVAPKINWLSNDRGRFASFRRIRASMNSNGKPFPLTLTATLDLNSDPNSELAIECPFAISPASLGESDTRELTICVKTIKLEKVS